MQLEDTNSVTSIAGRVRSIASEYRLSHVHLNPQRCSVAVSDRRSEADPGFGYDNGEGSGGKLLCDVPQGWGSALYPIVVSMSPLALSLGRSHAGHTDFTYGILVRPRCTIGACLLGGDASMSALGYLSSCNLSHPFCLYMPALACCLRLRRFVNSARR